LCRNAVRHSSSVENQDALLKASRRFAAISEGARTYSYDLRKYKSIIVFMWCVIFDYREHSQNKFVRRAAIAMQHLSEPKFTP
jgi:hypothetical protein